MLSSSSKNNTQTHDSGHFFYEHDDEIVIDSPRNDESG
jgi:hypothetical protein